MLQTLDDIYLIIIVETNSASTLRKIKIDITMCVKSVARRGAGFDMLAYTFSSLNAVCEPYGTQSPHV